jgi:ADP-ribose pyrophosphatase
MRGYSQQKLQSPKMSEDIQTLFETPYVALKTRNNWAYASRVKGRGAVGIIALTQENKIILVEQFRIPHNRNVIELPAGLIGDTDEGKEETPLEAAKKELWEETGYIAETLCAFGNPVSSSAGLSDETIQLFVATGLTKTDELFPWLLEQQSQGKITDPKTMTIPGILHHLGIE